MKNFKRLFCSMLTRSLSREKSAGRIRPCINPLADRHILLRLKNLVLMNSYGKILLVEDLADSRFMLRRLLELEGFAVIEASDGEIALDALRKYSCDAILLDLKMPNLDGIQFTKALRATTQFKAVPIIIVSAYDDDRTKAEAHAAGCNEYFTKPIDLEKLTNSLKKYISQTHLTGH